VLVDVGRPEAHLCVVGLVAAAAAVDQQGGGVAAVEDEVVLDRLRGEGQADLVLVVAAGAVQVGRDEHGRDLVVSDSISLSFVMGHGHGMTLYRSISVSSGGVGKPPS